MKPLSQIVTAILLVLSTPLVQSENVLFLGNSLTNRQVPKYFKRISKIVNGKVKVFSHTPGGSTWIYHSRAKDPQNLIKSRKWDAIVLQEQSYFLAQSHNFYSSHSLEPLRHMKPLLDKHAKKVVLFQTWGYFGEHYQYMQDRLVSGYKEAGETVNGKIAKVGQVWNKLYDKYEDILYKPDGKHPTHYGNYVSAYTIFCEVFDVSPEKVKYKPKNIRLEFKKDLIKAIKEVQGTAINNELVTEV